jgi:two-component system, NarL family, response regulator YdfI
MIRVLIVSPSIVRRTGLEVLLTTDPMIVVVGTSALLDAVSSSLPVDVILLDWSGQDDELILMSDPSLQAPIVMLVDDLLEGTIGELLRLGVRGVISNGATTPEMVGAIAAVAAGLTVLHPEGMESLLSVLPTTRPLPETPMQALTGREIEVLGMLAEGVSNKTIARRLTLSEHTVKFHISSIFSKLNASSRTEAVILGARQGLIFI